MKERLINFGIIDANIFEIIYIKKKVRVDTTNLYKINSLINAIINGLE